MDLRKHPRRARPGDPPRWSSYAFSLLLIAALSEPVFARILAEFDLRVALVAPMVVYAIALSLIFPYRLMPALTVLLILLVQVILLKFRPEPFGPSLARGIAEGQTELVGVVVAALTAGYAVVLARKRLPLWPWRTRTNLRILSRRPLMLARKYAWPLAILLVGAALDTATTMAFMYKDGIASEVHPGMRLMAQEFGVTLGVPIGTLVRLGFVVLVACVWRRWCGAILVICGILYALAAASNHFRWL